MVIRECKHPVEVIGIRECFLPVIASFEVWAYMGRPELAIFFSVHFSFPGVIRYFLSVTCRYVQSTSDL